MKLSVCLCDGAGENKAALVKLGGIAQIINVLSRHSQLSTVCHWAINALGILANNQRQSVVGNSPAANVCVCVCLAADDNKTEIAQLGGIQLMIAALQTHFLDTHLCKRVFFALAQLAVNHSAC